MLISTADDTDTWTLNSNKAVWSILSRLAVLPPPLPQDHYRAVACLVQCSRLTSDVDPADSDMAAASASDNLCTPSLLGFQDCMNYRWWPLLSKNEFVLVLDVQFDMAIYIENTMKFYLSTSMGIFRRLVLSELPAALMLFFMALVIGLLAASVLFFDRLKLL